MLCLSPSVDRMDRNSAFPNNPQDDTFPRLNIATDFVQENMASTYFSPSLDQSSSEQLVTSSPFKFSDILEELLESDYLNISDLSDLEGICTDDSVTTSPSLSPRSETEEVRPDKRVAYWNDYVTEEPEGIYDKLIAAPILTNSPSQGAFINVATSGNGLLYESTLMQNSDVYSIANNPNTIDNYTGNFDELDNVKLDPLEDDPETKMVSWNDVIKGIPNTDSINSSSPSLDSSKNIMTQTNNELMCAETSPLNTELCSLVKNSDASDNPPESYLNVGIKQEPIDTPESYLNADIKQEPIEDDHGEIICVCGVNKPDCTCNTLVNLEFGNKFMKDFDSFTECILDDSRNLDITEVLIRPEHGDVALNNLPSKSEPKSLDINIPCSSSAVMQDYSEDDDYNSSFNSLEETTIVNMADICPIFDKSRIAEPPASYLLNFYNGYPRSLRPIDKVRNDHCYTKSEIFDEPAPLQAAMNYNYFLDGVNEIPVPVKRRPGRPRKSSSTVHIEKAKVVLQRAAQKRAKKATQVKAKKIKMQIGTAAECQKRILHNQAERDRRSALRDSMFSVAHRCPDNMLRLTEIALAYAKSSRSEDVENNFTVDVLRRVDELMKKSDNHDKKLPRSKKSPHYSKMVMLLGITYFVTSLDRDLKAKESLLSRNESFLRNASTKYYKRFRKG